ncbi:hypothetical protein K450DRAFT_249585 [Umbelopsis ramanniana AG]|uniref:Uncharacterized protein n=1 Tax=Umbelopsis ramanniana AG TaxID=1314678 RepID=A0AAD5E7R2_UMBRA|nr:uncharacterized protein K450DRAFT_249585 [Umbelopsis ramanniana AG]KAI8577856.1 hypothetical protein K450DRAFT_249585 [Umbelopsis ramanniana AG]
MKFALVALASLLNLALAQVQSPDGTFNVTNPIKGGTFVQGKALPVVYDLLVNPITLQMNVYLVYSGSGNGAQVTIAQNADVTVDASSLQNKNNQSYWEHSINFAIPTTIPPGTYNVVFEDVTSHTNTTVPITINAGAMSVISTSMMMTSTVASSSAATSSASAAASSTSAPAAQSASNQLGFTWIPTAACLVMAAALAL